MEDGALSHLIIVFDGGEVVVGLFGGFVDGRSVGSGALFVRKFFVVDFLVVFVFRRFCCDVAVDFFTFLLTIEDISIQPLRSSR